MLAIVQDGAAIRDSPGAPAKLPGRFVKRDWNSPPGQRDCRRQTGVAATDYRNPHGRASGLKTVSPSHPGFPGDPFAVAASQDVRLAYAELGQVGERQIDAVAPGGFAKSAENVGKLEGET